MKLECLKSVNEMSGCTQALVRPDIFVHVVLCNCFFFFYMRCHLFLFFVCTYRLGDLLKVITPQTLHLNPLLGMHLVLMTTMSIQQVKLIFMAVVEVVVSI